MKSTWKIICKVILLMLFLYITPFFDGFRSAFQTSNDFMNKLVYRQQTIQQDLSLKKQLNVLSYNSNLTIPKEEIEIETTSETPMIVPRTSEKKVAKSPKKNGKKIYIYNTHQDEAYKGGKTVMDAAAILGKQLKNMGYEVILETNDFVAYRDSHHLTYNDAYAISNKYLSDALVNYGGFDLCIDFHRDSVPRNSSYLKIGKTSYAKSMMVVAGSSKNVKSATKISTTLTDNINKYKNGIMKSVMTRKEAFYNQFVHEGVILMECGSENNTFEEVNNTISIVAKGIDDLMK